MIALVLGDYLNALGIVRSLGPHGIVCHLAAAARGMAAWSVHVRRFHRLPDPAGDLASAAEALVHLCRRLPDRAMIFPTSETWLAVMMRARKHIEPHTVVPFCSNDVLAHCHDPHQIARVCGELGIAYPESVRVRCDRLEPDELARTFRHSRFPVIVKPSDKRRFLKIQNMPNVVFASHEQLAAWYRRRYELLRSAAMELSIQTLIRAPTDHLVAIQGYMDRTGRLAAYSGYTKLRQHPPLNGGSLCCRITRGSELAGLAERLLAKLEYHGLFDLEFVRDPACGDRLTCLDLNTRPGMVNYGSTAVGINLPLAAWLDYHDRLDVAAPGCFTSPLVWTRIIGDAAYSLLIHRLQGARGWSLAAFLRSLSGPKCFADVSLTDPGPGLYELLKLPLRVWPRWRRL